MKNALYIITAGCAIAAFVFALCGGRIKHSEAPRKPVETAQRPAECVRVFDGSCLEWKQL